MTLIQGKDCSPSESPRAVLFKIQQIGPRQYQCFVKGQKETPWGAIVDYWRPLTGHGSIAGTRKKAWQPIQYHLCMGFNPNSGLKGFGLIESALCG